MGLLCVMLFGCLLEVCYVFGGMHLPFVVFGILLAETSGHGCLTCLCFSWSSPWSTAFGGPA